MPSDIIPHSPQNLHDWLENLIAKIPTQGVAIGMPPAEITAFTGNLTAIQTPVDNVLAAQSALEMAHGVLRAALQANLPDVRREMRNMKTRVLYNDGIGADLDIVGTAATFDPLTYKPLLRVETFAGWVRVMGKKAGADAFNVYMRLKGQANFKLIAANRTRFPFNDDSPLAQPGVPEMREYQIRGVLADHEIGEPSDIASVLYGG